MGIHDTCALFFSSGTTGFPKAVEITHDNFVSQCMVLDDRSAFNFNVDSVNVSNRFMLVIRYMFMLELLECSNTLMISYIYVFCIDYSCIL